MTDKDLELAKKLSKMRLPTKGYAINILSSKTLYGQIRNRLHLTKIQLSDYQIKQTILFFNNALGNFLFENPEGFYIEVRNKLNGVFAISKHLPKEFRDNKFEKIEDIENLNIPQWRKNLYLKRYNTDILRRKDRNKVKNGIIVPFVNSHSMFYSYRFMWFNKRNCSFKKNRSWVFEISRPFKNKLYEVTKNGEKDYYEFQFDDFYHYKIKPIE